jgi:hypothetical protein
MLATWYERGRSRKQSLAKQADVGSQEYLLSLLDRGRRRRDTDKSAMDELGFGTGLWNGGSEGKEVGLMLTCGSYTSNPNLGNCVTLNLPEHLGELGQSKRMAAVLVSVAAAWEPDWAGVMSTDAMNARNFNARVPFVDWMFYLSNRIVPQVPLLSPPAKVQQVERLGCVVVVQGEPTDPANPEHLQNIERVQAALKAMV